MLITEWKMEDALTVRNEKKLEKGMEKSQERIARNALAEGATFEFVQKITGLDTEPIQRLRP